MRIVGSGRDIDEQVARELVLRLGPSMRRRWASGYVDQSITRDLAAIGETRDDVRLRRYIDALASNTAGSVADQTLTEIASLWS